MENLIKFLSLVFWILLITSMFLWYNDNKNLFFPKRETIEKSYNPNPFK